MSTRSEIILFASILGAELKMKASDIERLLRLAKTHGRLAVDACNRQLSEKEQKREKAVERQIAEIAQSYGAAAVFSGDPRGYTARLKLPSGLHTSMDGETVYIPA